MTDTYFTKSIAAGDKVAVAQQVYNGIQNQGVYTVTKVNRNKITVKGEHSRFERVFDSTKNEEIPKYKSILPACFLEPVQQQEQRMRLEKQQEDLWILLEKATQERNVQEMKTIIESISSLHKHN